jgi:cytochrome b561
LTILSARLEPSLAAAPRPPQTYDRWQRLFHWSMAAIVLCALALGLWASFLVPGTPFRKGLLEIHKSLGFTAAALILPRLFYRLASHAPAGDDGLGWLAHAAARAAHVCLYALMIIMPISGYIFSASGGNTLSWFGLFQFPRLLAKDAATIHFGQTVHHWGAYGLYVVVTAHLSAVVFHQFVKHDGVLARMLPPSSKSP